MAAVRHLGFVMRVWGPPTKGIWWSLSLCKMVGIDAVVLIICTFFDFRSLAWKRLFTPQNWGFLGENRERGGAILTSNELVLTFGGLHVCVQFGENRRRNATVRVHTDTHARTDAKRFYYLSHAICYSYGADKYTQSHTGKTIVSVAR